MHEFHDKVSTLLRQVASTVVMPRYRALRGDEIIEKTPGELVTIVDREAEVRLAEGLARLLPDARVIGEEAAASDPTLLRALADGVAWVVDPLDGTANYTAGHGPFGIIVALVADGTTLAGWLYDPVLDRMCHAARGGGAFVDGQRLRARSPTGELPVATLATQFMLPALRDNVIIRAQSRFQVRPIPRCAAEHYPRLCLGQAHVALFQRTLPWDHAAGALMLIEAGGRVARWDGTPYRCADPDNGLLATSTPALWDEAASALLEPELLDAVNDLRPQSLAALLPAYATER